MGGLIGLVAVYLFQLPTGFPADLLSDPATASAHDYCNRPVPEEVLGQADAALTLQPNEIAPEARAAAALVTAGMDIVDVHAEVSDCEVAFIAGSTRFAETLERGERRLRGESRFRASRDNSIAQIQIMLRDMWITDQAGRLAYLQLQTENRSGEAWWAYRRATAHVIATDAVATDAMREVLERYDWVDRDRFGARASGQAWLLVQHADHDPDFQRLALDRMQPYLDAGGVRRQGYAHLWDRVAVNTGQLQRYGTQPMDACAEDGLLDLKPVEDPLNLDMRRAEMGLGPVRQDLENMAAQRCLR